MLFLDENTRSKNTRSTCSLKLKGFVFLAANGGSNFLCYVSYISLTKIIDFGSLDKLQHCLSNFFCFTNSVI